MRFGVAVVEIKLEEDTDIFSLEGDLVSPVLGFF